MIMTLLRYQRVISLKTQVQITSQRNKWANTDTLIYRRWDQVCRRSKHSLSTGHIHSEPSFMIMNAELSPVKVSVLNKVKLLVWKMSNNIWLNKSLYMYKLDHCNGHRTCETLTSNENAEIPLTRPDLERVFLLFFFFLTFCADMSFETSATFP
jgi:hypothetical protein